MVASFVSFTCNSSFVPAAEMQTAPGYHQLLNAVVDLLADGHTLTQARRKTSFLGLVVDHTIRSMRP
jgi:hypothetical protein